VLLEAEKVLLLMICLVDTSNAFAEKVPDANKSEETSIELATCVCSVGNMATELTEVVESLDCTAVGAGATVVEYPVSNRRLDKKARAETGIRLSPLSICRISSDSVDSRRR
jgi:hypothetical protein